MINANKFQTVIVFLLCLFQLACATKESTADYTPDKVIARSDDRTSRPEWAKETQLIQDNGNSWLILGVAEVPGDSRVQAAFKVSDVNARGNLSQKIETTVTKIVEASDVGLSMEDQSLKSLVRELSQSTLSNVDIDERYWEKIVQTTSSGQTTIIMKVFSRIKISKSEFSKLLAVQAENSKNGSKDLRNKVESLIEKNLSTQFSEF